jgi:DNA-binding NarL/FixJ family response regulator
MTEKDLEEDAARTQSLTARQRTILELLSRGDTNKAIARQLRMREGTVKAHVRQIMAQVRCDEPHAARCCLRERPAQPKGGDTS